MLSGLEAAQGRLAGELADGAIAGKRSHQVDIFQAIAVGQVGHAGVGDVLLPAHLQPAEFGKPAENREPAVGDPALPAADVQFLEMWEAVQMQQFVVRQIDAGCVQPGNPELLHAGAEGVPLLLGLGLAKSDGFRLRHGLDVMLEAGPGLETIFAGQRELGFGERGGGVIGAELAEQVFGLFLQLLHRGSRGKAAGGIRHNDLLSRARVRITGGKKIDLCNSVRPVGSALSRGLEAPCALEAHSSATPKRKSNFGEPGQAVPPEQYPTV